MRINARSSLKMLKSIDRSSLEETRDILKPIKSSQRSNRQILFILNLDIGKGRNGKIEFKEGDKPEKLSLEFCQKNSLNIKVYEFIVKALVQKQKEVAKATMDYDFEEEGEDYIEEKTFSNHNGVNEFDETKDKSFHQRKLDSSVFDNEDLNQNLFSFNPSEKDSQKIKHKILNTTSPQTNGYKKKGCLKNSENSEYIFQNRNYFLARKSISSKNSPMMTRIYQYNTNRSQESEENEEKKKNFFVKERSKMNSKRSLSGDPDSRNSFFRSTKDKSIRGNSRSKNELSDKKNLELDLSDNFKEFNRSMVESQNFGEVERKKKAKINVRYSGFLGKKRSRPREDSPETGKYRSRQTSRSISLNKKSKRNNLKSPDKKQGENSRPSNSRCRNRHGSSSKKPRNRHHHYRDCEKSYSKSRDNEISAFNIARRRNQVKKSPSVGIKRSNKLYMGAKRMVEKKKKKAKKYFEELEEQENKYSSSFSFHPQINRTSELIAMRGIEGSSGKGKTVYERLIDKGDVYRSRKFRTRKRRADEEVRGFKFKPKVNRM